MQSHHVMNRQIHSAFTMSDYLLFRINAMLPRPYTPANRMEFGLRKIMASVVIASRN